VRFLDSKRDVAGQATANGTPAADAAPEDHSGGEELPF